MDNMYPMHNASDNARRLTHTSKNDTMHKGTRRKKAQNVRISGAEGTAWRKKTN